MFFFFNSDKIFLLTIFVIFLSTFEEIQACIKDAPGYEKICNPTRGATKCCPGHGTCTAASGWKCVGGLEKEKAENITEI